MNDIDLIIYYFGVWVVFSLVEGLAVVFWIGEEAQTVFNVFNVIIVSLLIAFSSFVNV